MPTPVIISLTVSTVFFVAAVILLIVRLSLITRSFVYTVKGKQVIIRITAARGAQLFVDGILEEQFSDNHAFRFTLRTMIDGEEFKAHVSIGFSVQVEAYYHDTLLTPDSVGK